MVLKRKRGKAQQLTQDEEAGDSNNFSPINGNNSHVYPTPDIKDIIPQNERKKRDSGAHLNEDIKSGIIKPELQQGLLTPRNNGGGSSSQRLGRNGVSKRLSQGSPEQIRLPFKNAASSGLNSSQLDKYSQYPRGGILKIAVKNFVTYDSCEFYPGPCLNMIIGPNGTGKSTIVCSLALGLGGNPSLLGRAKDISEFVKHGHENAWIEITIKGSIDDDNEDGGQQSTSSENNSTTVIKRFITRSSNKSTWKLNHRQTPFTEIHKVIRSFRIQVDNLCQFLPQDRVVEFSKMSPQKLLVETQKAVGRYDLVELQEKLIKYRSEEKILLHDIKKAMEDEVTLVKQNEVIERDVQRWQEREEAENKVRALKLQIPLARYASAKKAYEESKHRRKEAHARYIRLQREVMGPTSEEISEAKSMLEKCDRKQQSLKTESRADQIKMRKVLEQLGRQERNVHELHDQIKAIEAQDQRKKEEILQAQRELSELESRVGSSSYSRGGEDPKSRREELQRQLDELFEQEQQYRTQIDEFKDQQQQIRREGREYQAEIEQATRGLQKLDDVKNRKWQILNRFSREAAEAVKWLDQNQSMFKKHVFSPVCMQINVNDNLYSPIIESLIRAGTHKTFVCQTDEDYMTLTREVNDNLRLRINVVAITPDSKRLENYRPPLPADQIKKLGFTGYALDLIEAPEPVLTYLCDSEKLHSIPISLQEVNNDEIERLGVFSSYVAGKTQYTISRARYGARNTSVMTSRIKPFARLLSSGETAELANERNQLIKSIERCRLCLQENENKIRELAKQEERVIEDQRRAIDPERQRLQREKENLRIEVQTYERNMVKVENMRRKLQMLKQSQSSGGGETAVSIAEKKEEIRNNLKANAKMRGELIKQLNKMLRKEVDRTMKELPIVIMEIMKLKQQIVDLEAQQSEYQAQLAEALDDVNETKRQCEEDKAQASDLLREARSVTETISDEDRELMQNTLNSETEMDLDELETELERAQQRLELSAVSGLTSQVIEEYRKRQKELKQVKKKVKELKRKWKEVVRSKVWARKEWEEPLEVLVKKISRAFSESFESIKCQGEVRLSKVGGPSETLSIINAQNGNGAGDIGSQQPSQTQQSPSQPVTQTQTAADDDIGGSIEAMQDEEYEQWGIEISVSFRATEAMQVLTNHRQSGGERAVSTVMYLQSLQYLTAAPFRVVDEINQGMDERNERLIHRRIIHTVCQPPDDQNGGHSNGNGDTGREFGSQYFLITPKLLPNLEYHNNMKVLCIYNGEWQPEKFNTRKFLRAAAAAAMR
ncbi:Structural maintenance of chromosomes protein 5 [Mycoemilia scoparia]|uniref:Structural maintenance of chromosomes protein 5 n=1 Tax=Mycoemilia scoparia TaxID=417184 RepID=A0A9W8DLH0_9FUNG|nr:Structural maintenance of chromosomes protein 5 [Mycoemilia scoparia]